MAHLGTLNTPSVCCSMPAAHNPPIKFHCILHHLAPHHASPSYPFDAPRAQKFSRNCNNRCRIHATSAIRVTHPVVGCPTTDNCRPVASPPLSHESDTEKGPGGGKRRWCAKRGNPPNHASGIFESHANYNVIMCAYSLHIVTHSRELPAPA